MSPNRAKNGDNQYWYAEMQEWFQFNGILIIAPTSFQYVHIKTNYSEKEWNDPSQYH